MERRGAQKKEEEKKLNGKFGQAIKKAVGFVIEIRDMSFPEDVAEEMCEAHFEIWAHVPQTGHIVWDEGDGKWKKPGEGWNDIDIKDDDIETVAFTVGKALRALADEYSEVRDVITKGTELPDFYVTLEYNAFDRNGDYMWTAEQEMEMREVIIEG